jgi:hypothetical protein
MEISYCSWRQILVKCAATSIVPYGDDGRRQADFDKYETAAEMPKLPPQMRRSGPMALEEAPLRQRRVAAGFGPDFLRFE